MNRIAIITLLAASAVAFSSCGGKDDEPSTDQTITITESYMPAGVGFDKTDTQFMKRCQKWNETNIVVNSANDLPDDPLGFSPSYSKIDFSRNTLLLTYRLHRWTIDTYSDDYTYNLATGTYDWSITLGATFFDEEESDEVHFTRFAVLVPKQPAGATTRVSVTLKDTSFNWD